MKDKLFKELNKIINEILCTNRIYEPSTQLLGKGCIMDSIVLLAFITKVNQKYNIDILENDFNLDCLESLECLIDYICDLLKA